MDTNSFDLLRRSLRAAVFRTERLRLSGRIVEADEQIAGELSAATAQLATLGEPAPAETIRRWQNEDLTAFDFATLVAELVADRTGALRAPVNRFDADAAAAPPQQPPSVAVPQEAFPSPATGIPGLADLLDDMLSQDRRRRPHPRS